MKILIVEDEEKIAAFVKRGLKEEGYAADIACDGEQGFFLAGTNDYDLIILDLLLPKIDGITLCKKIRKEKISTPIIMVTAKDKISDKVVGLDAGANDYLTKPFAFEELLARVRALLRGAKVVKEGTELKYKDLVLDLVKHTVTREEKKIILTNREFSLLEYFMRNEETVLTRTMIAEHVWDINFDTASNTIDVFVNYLRKKVDTGFKKKLINTVRGRGYILKG